MPLQATSGAASYDAFGGGVAAVPNYIEDVFSTWLYPSVSGDNQIINNIDLSANGGLVWIKSRERASNHYLIDTVRGSSAGNTKSLSSNTTTAQTSGPNLDWLQFNNNGFTAKAVTGGGELGTNTYYGNMASWTFRKQPKFFDVVTFTAPASGSLTVNHNLDSAPGCIVIKRTNGEGDWVTYHRSTGAGKYLLLNSTGAVATYAPIWANVTSTSFEVTVAVEVNANDTYVAYLFAHDAGGFGLTGTDNVISCGSFTTNGSGVATVDLGYEPQWVMVKKTSAGDEANAGFWWMQDNMRGYPVRPGNSHYLQANTSDAETFVSGGGLTFPTSTGFVFNQNYAGFHNSNFIYIAIRRGPMKVPTDGTKVFAVNLAADGATAPLTWNTNSTVDSVLNKRNLSNTNGNNIFVDRLRGNSATLTTNSLNGEGSNANITDLTISNGYIQKLVSTGGSGGAVTYAFSRAPGFFDEVCWTSPGSSSNERVTHNLGVAPELIFMKQRNGSNDWWTYNAPQGRSSWLTLNTASASNTNANSWGTSNPTATDFGFAANYFYGSSTTNVAYLFATCPGVSKVGTFSFTTGGSSTTVDCGFTSGPRFVLLKKTNGSGDWHVFDSARGIVSGNDPRIELNTTDAESDGFDVIDATSSGFVFNDIFGESNSTYIYLAIA